MAETIAIPKRLVEEVRRRGLSIEDLVVDALSKALNIDPKEIAEARLELASRFMEEVDDYLSKGDPIQASEKLYKAVEECVKALAEKFEVKMLDTVRKRGKWDTWILGEAATELAVKLGEEKVSHVWSQAYDIHVWGFHGAKYSIDRVKFAVPLAKWLLGYTRKALKS